MIYEILHFSFNFSYQWDGIIIQVRLFDNNVNILNNVEFKKEDNTLQAANISSYNVFPFRLDFVEDSLNPRTGFFDTIRVDNSTKGEKIQRCELCGFQRYCRSAR